MADSNIRVSDSARAFAERKAREAGFASPDQYIEAVLSETERREARREELEALLLAGLDSGPAEPFTPEDWDAIRLQGLRLIEERKDRP
jgi:hypothetical protein